LVEKSDDERLEVVSPKLTSQVRLTLKQRHVNATASEEVPEYASGRARTDHDHVGL